MSFPTTALFFSFGLTKWNCANDYNWGDKNNEKPAALSEDNITIERKTQNSKKNKLGFFKKRLSSDLNFTETEGDYDL